MDGWSERAWPGLGPSPVLAAHAPPKPPLYSHLGLPKRVQVLPLLGRAQGRAAASRKGRVVGKAPAHEVDAPGLEAGVGQAGEEAPELQAGGVEAVQGDDRGQGGCV